MQFVSADSTLSFEMTYDSPSLNVGLSVYDDSGVSPVLVSGPALMDNVVGNMYRGKFSPQIGKSYLVFKAVYTDALLTVLNTEYPTGSESFTCDKSFIKDGQIVVRKNKPIANFTFIMIDMINQIPTAGFTVTAQRSQDGGAFSACDNTVTSIGNGFYKINLSAADLNCDVIAINFSAFGADNTILTMLTQA